MFDKLQVIKITEAANSINTLDDNAKSQVMNLARDLSVHFGLIAAVVGRKVQGKELYLQPVDNTYVIKDELKQAGFKWNGVVWKIDFKDINFDTLPETSYEFGGR